MSKRAEFMASLGLTDSDLSEPTGTPTKAAPGPRAAPRAAAAAPAPSAPMAGGGDANAARKREEFLRSLGIDNVGTAPPAGAARNATGSQEYSTGSSPDERSAVASASVIRPVGGPTSARSAAAAAARASPLGDDRPTFRAQPEQPDLIRGRNLGPRAADEGAIPDATTAEE